jgi:dTDP-4-amino-4,6-dideoxygalactose transaminase
MSKSEICVPFSPPLIEDDEIAAVVDTLRSGWITTGPKTFEFADAFAHYCTAPGALPLSSCTAALHTALATLGVGPGDEVITTPITFCATVNVIEQLGATPVLADVDPDTLNIDPARIAAAITPRTKVILPVHYAGHPVDLDAINGLAAAHGLTVVEDAAHAVAARYKGRRIGDTTNPCAFSFYATKNLTTGEGGMLTGEPDFLAKARIVSHHGMDRDAWKRYGPGGSWRYDVLMPGFKYNMTDIEAALGLVQLNKIDWMQARRLDVITRYMAAFAALDAYDLPTSRPEIEHAWHLFVLRARPGALTIERDQFIDEMAQRGVATSVHFIPIHIQPYYRDKYGYDPGDFPVAYREFLRLVSLPLNPRMDDGDVEHVIDAVRDITERFRR